jgi:hypothetical protein
VLFLFMWRAINRNVPKAWGDGRRQGSTSAGDLLAGAMLFNKKFTAAWAADGHREYLSPPPVVPGDGKSALARIMQSGSNARALAATAASSALAASSVAGPLGAHAAHAYLSGGAEHLESEGYGY